MKKCIIVPDSYKGTMNSIKVSEIMKTSVLEHFPDCDVKAIPISDGGEGTVDCFLKTVKGKKKNLRTLGPFLNEVESFYGISGDTAIIEMAASAGLSLAQGKLDPMKATTYGVGELIKDAVAQGCRKIIIGLGGSCTNDAGVGMAAALGTKFYDNNDKEFIPVGESLSKIARIDTKDSDALLKGIEITAMCDIENPMHGEQGAAYVFAPQKGADSAQVKILDRELKEFANILEAHTGLRVDDVKGAGAAGAMGAGIYALLGGKLKQGINIVLDLVGFENLLQGCDCVFTGEGRLDSQSLSGKVVAGVGKRAKKKGVPVIAVVGTAEIREKAPQLKESGITKVYETDRKRKDFEDVKKHCEDDLKAAMRKALADMSH